MMDTFDELFDIFKPKEVGEQPKDDDPLFAAINSTTEEQTLSAEVSESRTIENSLQSIRQKLTIINE